MPRKLKEDVVGLVELVSNAVDAYTAALFLFDDKSPGTLSLYAYHSLSDAIDPDAKIPVGYGLIGWVAKNEKPTHAKQFDMDTSATLRFYTKPETIKSFAATPVFAGDRLIGVLAIDSKSSYCFTDKTLKIISGFAAAIANARSSGRAKIKLKREATSHDALHALVDRIIDCTSISSICQVLRLRLPDLIPHEGMAVAVRSFDDNTFHLLSTEEVGTEPKDNRVPLPLATCRLGMVVQHKTLLLTNDRGEIPLYPGCDEKYRSFLGSPIIGHGEAAGAIAVLSERPKAFNQRDTKTLGIVAAVLSSAITSLYLHNRSRLNDYLDPLTHLFNHHSLLSREAALAPSALAVVNLLHFTEINQKFGHEGGDAVLKETARRLGAIAGDEGEVCRYYGDQFILYFAGIKRKGVASLLDAAARAIESEPYFYDGYEFNASPAIGVAYVLQDPIHFDHLINLAYHASEQASTTMGARVVESGTIKKKIKLRSVN